MGEKINYPVNLSFLSPRPGVGLLLQAFRHFSDFNGLSEKQMMDAIRGRMMPQEKEQKLNFLSKAIDFFSSRKSDTKNLGDLLVKVYGFENSHTAEENFLEAQKSARELINYLIDLYGLDRDRFGLKDEVYIPDPNILRILAYLNPRPNDFLKRGTDERTRFEQWRELFLVDLFLRIAILGKKEKWADVISELQQRFNNELYLGQAGKGKTITYYFNTDEKNGVVDLNRKLNNKRVKTIETRGIRVGDKKISMEVNWSIKSGSSKLLKVLIDHLKKGEFIFSPFDFDSEGKPALQDRLRFSIVLTTNDFDNLIHLFKTFFGSIEIKPPSKDSSQKPNYKNRIIANYRGIPIEIILYDIEGYINSEIHCGKVVEQEVKTIINGREKTIKFNIHDGSSHYLYELRRSLSVLFLFFPYEIYAKRDEQGRIIQSEDDYIKEMVETVERRDREIVSKLKDRYLIK